MSYRPDPRRVGADGSSITLIAVIVWGLLMLWGVFAIYSALTGPRGDITYDPGGYVSARAIDIANSPPERITGFCASACTMELLTGCLTPEAELLFHGPRTTPDRFDHWSGVMARHYPPLIATLFMERMRFGEYRMTGAAAISLGARPCLE